MEASADVVVIGGGPGGATTATLLAQSGLDVVLFERETFPRYHIGESLLPSCLKVFDLIGARDRVAAAGFQLKPGAYFEWGQDGWYYDFGWLAEGLTHGWQVDRGRFDQVLLEHARSCGVKVREACEVTGLEFAGERPVTARWRSKDGSEGEISFAHLVDASGRAGLLATRYLDSRIYNKLFQNIAVWGYWVDTTNVERVPTGAIAVLSIDDGWLWTIPFADGRLSVGLVIDKERFKARRGQGETVESIYRSAIQESEVTATNLAGARQQGDLRTDQDYSYGSSVLARPGAYMVGDSACFLDPLLSTGVHLATFSAVLAAAAIASSARAEVDEAAAAAFYEEAFRRAYLRLMVLVEGFYQQYIGRDSYWKRGHELIGSERAATLDPQAAFGQIVTGLADFVDVEDPSVDDMSKWHAQMFAAADRSQELPGSIAEEDRERVLAQSEFSLAMRASRLPTSPRHAAAGLYLVTQPRLGLAPAPRRAAAGAPN